MLSLHYKVLFDSKSYASLISHTNNTRFIILHFLIRQSFGPVLVTEGHTIMKEDSVTQDFSNQPYFGLYKDNYFIFGPPIGYKANRKNTNVKFQISISQRLTRATLPWGTYLYLFYTQKVFEYTREFNAYDRP